MIELFDTISSYIDKFLTYVDTLFNSIGEAVIELKTWVSYLPLPLITAAGIIIVLLVVFRILGR